MNKSEYIAKLEKESSEMNNAFNEVVALCRDEKNKEYGFLIPLANLIEGIQLRFKHNEDTMLTIIESVSFK